MYISKGRVVTKMVGAAEFKAKCLKLIDEMQRDGEPVTITKRGKPVATLSVVTEEKPRLSSILGALKSPEYRFDDPFSPAYDGPWDAEKDGPWEPEV
jgi:prevent-host-death family protein